MHKESSFTVKFYLNQDVKPKVLSDGRVAFPLYTRIIHGKKSTNFKYTGLKRKNGYVFPDGNTTFFLPLEAERNIELGQSGKFSEELNGFTKFTQDILDYEKKTLKKRFSLNGLSSKLLRYATPILSVIYEYDNIVLNLLMQEKAAEIYDFFKKEGSFKINFKYLEYKLGKDTLTEILDSNFITCLKLIDLLAGSAMFDNPYLWLLKETKEKFREKIIQDWNGKKITPVSDSLLGFDFNWINNNIDSIINIIDTFANSIVTNQFDDPLYEVQGLKMRGKELLK